MKKIALNLNLQILLVLFLQLLIVAFSFSENSKAQETEESGVLGPGKGVTAKSDLGFKLSPEAEKLFRVQSKSWQEIIAKKPNDFPKNALIRVKNEKYFFRIRDHWIKRFEFKEDFWTSQQILEELRDSDRIVVSGTELLRITELFAENGHEDGH